MSEKLENDPASIDPSHENQTQVAQPGRRLFVFKAAAVLGAAASMLAPGSEALAKDPGFGHQDPEGMTHVYDVAARPSAPADPTSNEE